MNFHSTPSPFSVIQVQGGRNRLVTDGPRITTTTAPRNSLLTKQLQAVAAAQASSRGKSSPGETPPVVRGSQSAGQPPEPPQRRASREGEEASECQPQESPQRCDSEERLCEGSPADCGKGDAGSRDLGVQSEAAPCGADVVGSEDGSKDGARTISVISRSESENQVFESRPEPLPVGDAVPSTASDALAPAIAVDDTSYSSGDETKYFSPKPTTEDADSIAFSSQSGFSSIQSHGKVPGSFESKEDDSGVVLSPVTSSQSSPEKAQRPASIQLWARDTAKVEASADNKTVNRSKEDCMQGGTNIRPDVVISRSHSAPNGSAFHMAVTPVLTPSTTPTHSQAMSFSAASTPTTATAQLLLSPSHPPPLTSPVKTNRPFNPFPVKHVNTNRAKTGLKLGLYTPSTLQHIQGQLCGGSLGRKARNASS